jgi:hypothetical protein
LAVLIEFLELGFANRKKRPICWALVCASLLMPKPNYWAGLEHFIAASPLFWQEWILERKRVRRFRSFELAG